MKYEAPEMNYEVEFNKESSEIQQYIFPSSVDPVAIAAVILIAAITVAL
ncbi:MAG: hypothetical protein WC209_17130 [Ignavibacteriaceae bacterium]|jgi:hypothetical protein